MHPQPSKGGVFWRRKISQEQIQVFGCGCLALVSYGFAAVAVLVGIAQLM
jgi:hypothetical protein